MSARTFFQQGIAPILIILIICFGFISIFLLWNVSGLKFNVGKPYRLPAASPTNTPATQPQKLSLKELCLAEIKILPKPPFRYQSQDEAVGTLLPIYRKDRFKGAKNTASCYTGFMFNRVMEQAYADMGLQYYERGKGGTKYIKTGAIQAFEKAVDLSLSESFKKEGWKRTTQYGENNGFVAVMSLTKTKDGREYFLDAAYPGASGVAFSYTVTVMEK